MEGLSLQGWAAELSNLVREIQPGLTVETTENAVELVGEFRLSDADGVYDRFQIRLTLPSGYPSSEPALRETAERIPAGPNRHINPDGSCCFGVWEKWYLLHSDRSVRALLNGPIQSYFVSQVIFELTGKWRFGEHAHGANGLVEAGAELLNCEPDLSVVVSLVEAIVSGKEFADDPCPCSSGAKAKACHGAKAQQLRCDHSVDMLARLKGRIESQRFVLAAANLESSIRAAINEMDLKK